MRRGATYTALAPPTPLRAERMPDPPAGDGAENVAPVLTLSCAFKVFILILSFRFLIICVSLLSFVFLRVDIVPH